MKGRVIFFHLLAIAFWFFAASYAAAQTDTPVKTESSGHESHTVLDSSKSSPSSDTGKTPADNDDMSQHMKMMDEHLKKMDTQMEKIRSAADPQERQKLMQEHMADMKEGMKMMKSMPGCKMMSGGSMMSGGGMMKEGHGMGNMMKCHQMMEMKMKMMQNIVEGTLESSQMAK